MTGKAEQQAFGAHRRAPLRPAFSINLGLRTSSILGCPIRQARQGQLPAACAARPDPRLPQGTEQAKCPFTTLYMGLTQPQGSPTAGLTGPPGLGAGEDLCKAQVAVASTASPLPLCSVRVAPLSPWHQAVEGSSTGWSGHSVGHCGKFPSFSNASLGFQTSHLAVTELQGQRLALLQVPHSCTQAILPSCRGRPSQCWMAAIHSPSICDWHFIRAGVRGDCRHIPWTSHTACLLVLDWWSEIGVQSLTVSKRFQHLLRWLHDWWQTLGDWPASDWEVSGDQKGPSQTHLVPGCGCILVPPDRVPSGSASFPGSFS